MAYIGNTVQTQGFAPAIDYFSGNGVTVTFTLSRPVASVAQMIVAIDNVIQNPSSAYTVSGNAITFTSAPLSGTNNIWVEYTSLITTYNGISQSPSVIGDLTASGGYLSTGSFNNSFVDGTIVDYVTGNGRVTVGTADGFTLYNGGTSARSSLLAMNANGAMGVGTSPSYGTTGQVLISSGTSSAPTWITLLYTASYLIVAGGGGGGGYFGGGGGAGGLLTNTAQLLKGFSYTIVVGAGGAGGVATGSQGSNGADSTFYSLTATGGGGGGNSPFTGGSGNILGVAGGSGGGGGLSNTTTSAGGAGTSGQGNAGGTTTVYGGGAAYSCSGGGGAGAVGGSGNGGGSTGVAGGVGLASSITGSSVYYAGGGGSFGSSTGGAGGTGGGGAGGINGSVTAGAGTTNTGGGGGGSSQNAGFRVGGAGGSGVVIISVPTSSYSGTTTGSPTVSTSGSNTIMTFTTSGSYTD